MVKREGMESSGRFGDAGFGEESEARRTFFSIAAADLNGRVLDIPRIIGHVVDDGIGVRGDSLRRGIGGRGRVLSQVAVLSVGGATVNGQLMPHVYHFTNNWLST